MWKNTNMWQQTYPKISQNSSCLPENCHFVGTPPPFSDFGHTQMLGSLYLMSKTMVKPHKLMPPSYVWWFISHSNYFDRSIHMSIHMSHVYTINPRVAVLQSPTCRVNSTWGTTPSWVFSPADSHPGGEPRHLTWGLGLLPQRRVVMNISHIYIYHIII